MGTLILQTDEELDLWLATLPNKSETARNALRLYKGDITTDTIQGLRASYKSLTGYMDEKFTYYDQCFERMDKLISVLETRM